ncbi:ABC transporter ATP-binding protein [Xylanimonas allomyrinae]|uniref:ABC transporter ATP-binding protein n=1 Tax=Xylanimonas allomyrinae TaxID=2509459 RepID=A0A4P6EKC5_9MICO|nr:ABC transporter ATP-binding protein [Xylanimonas allomyrinae]QAY62566.1 ABC transporter ATP-binding protein [Xylanimonas allomyrinae]
MRGDTTLSAESAAGAAVGASLELAFSLDGISKEYGSRPVLTEVSLSAPRGSAFGLLGPNGAGKTTLIRVLTGLLTPSRGSVRLLDEPLTARSADTLRARVGVQCDGNLYDLLSLRDNLAIWGDLFGLGRERRDRRIVEVLELFGLSDRADDPVGSFSKGMRQKAAVARAMLHEPELLILDEPTAGLDPEAAADLIENLSTLLRTREVTVLICTHQLQGLETLCDQVGILVAGRMRVAGAVDDLIRARWPRLDVDFTVEGPMAAARQVLAEASQVPPLDLPDGGVRVELGSSRDVPAVVARLVEAGADVLAAVPRRHTIEDLYFATIDDDGSDR